jgi:capsule polysaccharide export protein KpsE/RkpR
MTALSDLSVIDDVLGNIASEVRRSQERISLTNERLTEAKSEYEKLKPMEDRITDFEFLKLDNESLLTIEARFTKLGSLITRVREAKIRITEFEEKFTEGKDIVALGAEAISLNDSADELRDLIKQVEALQKVKAPPPLDSVTTAYDAWQDAVGKAGNLRLKYIRLVEASNAESTWKEKLRLAENKFHQQTKGKNCPVCEKPI